MATTVFQSGMSTGARNRRHSEPARPKGVANGASIWSRRMMRRSSTSWDLTEEMRFVLVDAERAETERMYDDDDSDNSELWDSDDDYDSDESDEDSEDEDEEWEDGATTLMLADIPEEYTRTMLLKLFEQEGFAMEVRFLFLPALYTSGHCLGHAFIDLGTPEAAVRFRDYFRGFRQWGLPTNDGSVPVGKRSGAKVATCAPVQGFAANVEAYRNDRLMHESVPDEMRPVLLENGQRVPFPPPTRAIVKPSFPKKRGMERSEERSVAR